MMTTGDMDVLVTGAAGMAGRAMVPVLRSAGHRVVATDLPASWRIANPAPPPNSGPSPGPDASGIDSGKAQRLLGWQAHPQLARLPDRHRRTPLNQWT